MCPQLAAFLLDMQSNISPGTVCLLTTAVSHFSGDLRHVTVEIKRRGTDETIHHTSLSNKQVLGKKEACDAGTIETPKATVVTYVDQDPVFAEGATVRDAVFAADNPLMRCDKMARFWRMSFHWAPSLRGEFC